MSEEDSKQVYVKWATEILDKLLDDRYAPYFASHSKEIINILAEKLKDDIESFVLDWYCDDCSPADMGFCDDCDERMPDEPSWYR